MPKKNRKYSELVPTIDAISRIGLAVQAHKDIVMEGLLACLWERHMEEIVGDHGGDATCSYCDHMRAACRLLKIGSPRLAAFDMPERGPLYREVDL